LFDLLHHCPLLIKHIELGKVGFGINHEMYDFRTGRKKDLDLVLCTPGKPDGKSRKSFDALAAEYSVQLTKGEKAQLAMLPELLGVSVGSVLVAIEAKACMTEHLKALPRLYDELNSSHLAIHNSAEAAIAVGFALVNVASQFMSTSRNKVDLKTQSATVTRHKQPLAAIRTIGKLNEIPRRTREGAEGFDAFGVVTVEMVNDGSTVEIASEPQVPAILHYDQMIHRIAALYATKFGNI